MLLKIIADLALQDIEESGNDIGQAVMNAVNTVGAKRNMTQREISDRVRKECRDE